VGPSLCGGSVGAVTIGSSAGASAGDGWIAASVCGGRAGEEVEASGCRDPVWLTCWRSSPTNQHLRLLGRSMR
jgi:hypothetical protein